MKSHTTRFLSLVLALVLSCSLCVPASATSEFTDVPVDHWAYEAIQNCVASGIVTGFGDGRFCPEDPVTSVQLIVMLTRTFYGNKLEEAKKTETSSWYAPYVKVASDLGIGKSLTIQDVTMNRYDMALALYNTITIEGKTSGVTREQLIAVSDSIKDWDSVPVNRRAGVKYCYILGIITGMEDGGFHGEETMTRAQACTVMQRMITVISGDTPPQTAAPAQPGQPQQQETPAEANTGKLANGEDITDANVLAILDEIKREYPAGTVWGNSGTAGNHYYANGGTPGSDMANLNAKFKAAGTQSSTSLKYACGGWACMVTERIFGKTGYPFREVTDPSKVRPGDVLITVNNNGFLTHVSIASSAATPVRNAATGKTVYQFSTCGGNVNGLVKWATDAGSTITSNFRCFTRYPD